PINGIYFKGIMGDTITDQPMLFAVVDCNGHYLAEQQIQLDMVTGDGILGPRSIMTDNAGVAGFAYCFSGNLANASFRLYLENLDTIKVYVRADALIPGGHGQAQYILFDDTYADVKNFNGEPASLDIITDHCIMYANYEESLGVVVMLYDLDYNQQVYDTSSVYGVIVNSVYSGTTLDNPAIGVLSPLADLRQLWGVPDDIKHSPPRPATVIRYDSLPGKFYGHWESGMADTLIEEIHLFEPVEQASPISLLNLDTSQ
ncbi:MAG: hypothetical protein U9N55_01500, partial [candidate division Zixibacteria bacterium]|nr:hypothetical protein [candidate division Zixibacteria bacterium]